MATETSPGVGTSTGGTGTGTGTGTVTSVDGNVPNTAGAVNSKGFQTLAQLTNAVNNGSATDKAAFFSAIGITGLLTGS